MPLSLPPIRSVAAPFLLLAAVGLGGCSGDLLCGSPDMVAAFKAALDRKLLAGRLPAGTTIETRVKDVAAVEQGRSRSICTARVDMAMTVNGRETVAGEQTFPFVAERELGLWIRVTVTGP